MNASLIPTRPLGDVAKVISGYAFKSAEFGEKGVPVIKIKNIRVGTVDLGDAAYVDERFLELDSKYHVNPGDLLISLTGSHPNQPNSVVGRVARMGNHQTLCLLNQRAGKIYFRKGAEGDLGYLFYVLSSPKFRNAVAMLANGAASQANVSPTQVEGLEIPFPDLTTQRKIAGILSAYDDLIENNLRRIKILEEMAQFLYREWFVHFRFPGHESAKFSDSSLGRIPNGWGVRKILDFTDVIYGFSFKANRFNTAGEGIPVVRIRNIQDGQSETYTEEEGDPKHRIKNGDILVGMDGDFHMTIWSGGDAWQNQRVAKFRPKGAMGNYLLFLTLEKPIHFFDSTITGTTVAHLGDSHIKSIEFASPPEALMRKASDLLEPLAQEQLNLRRRNQTLRLTRDLLMPKLLSP